MKTLNGGQELKIPCKIGDYCLYETGLCVKKMRVKGFSYCYPDGLRIDLGDVQPVAWHPAIVGYIETEDDIMNSPEAVRMRGQMDYK